ncbi:MAG: NAD(P)-binding domain-containing protein, partial [Planctomycetia bacterium]
MKLAIVGAGVIGTSLGLLLQRSGHTLVALSSRTKRRAQAAAALLGGVEVVADAALAAMGADVVLLAVPDREIAALGERIAKGGALRRGAVVA